MTTIIDSTEASQCHPSASVLPLAATSELIERVAEFTSADIRRIAGTCRALSSVADEIDWWHATACVRRLLRAQHLSQAAASAARSAARAVRLAARNAGLGLDDADVILVARAAGDAASALTAGRDAYAEIAYFLDRLGSAPVAPGRSGVT